jgi:hypothetical protein
LKYPDGVVTDQQPQVWTGSMPAFESDNKPPINGKGGRREEEGFAAGLRRFSRRLATFGLGESQEPLLTDAVSSYDAEGNPR